MSIRTRNIHFTNWAKVIEALADKGVTVADESAARTFLTETSSDANPYYYYVGYIKDTQEIYTHGKFYSCSDSSYDDTELRDLIGTKADLSALEALSAEVKENEKVTAAALTELHENKADKSEIPDVSTFATKDELNTLNVEVDNKVDSTTFTTLSETVAGHTTSIDNLSNNKADKTDLDDYATQNDLNAKQDLLVSGTNIKTVNSNSILGSGNIDTPDTKVTSAANHYGYNSNNATSTTGAFVTKITKDEANHVTSFESRALTSTDIPSLDASKITSGTISIERLPAGALERMFVVESEAAAMSATVQEGDVVQVTGNSNKMYFCISDTATTFATKFKEFTAGTATSVPWSGITGKPDLATQEELDVVDAKFDNYQPKITSSNKLDYSLISGTPDLSGYATQTWVENKGYLLASTASSTYQPKITSSNKLDYSLISGTPTIPTKLSQLTDDVVSGEYLPLSGGALSGNLYIDGGWETDFGLYFREGGSDTYGFNFTYGDGDCFRLNTRADSTTNVEVFKVYRGGNFVVFASTPHVGSYKVSLEGHTHSNYMPIIGGGDVMEIGRYIDFHYDAGGSEDFTLRLEPKNSTTGVEIKLPDSSGTLALDNHTHSYLPLSGGTLTGAVTSTSTFLATDFITRSDNRLKDFVSDINVDFESLKQIPKKYYYWKDKSMGEDLQLGTSAQELAKVYPECVHYDETNDRYSVNYQKLSIVALAAIDKLHDRILELESKLYD